MQERNAGPPGFERPSRAPNRSRRGPRPSSPSFRASYAGLLLLRATSLFPRSNEAPRDITERLIGPAVILVFASLAPACSSDSSPGGGTRDGGVAGGSGGASATAGSGGNGGLGGADAASGASGGSAGQAGAGASAGSGGSGGAPLDPIDQACLSKARTDCLTCCYDNHSPDSGANIAPAITATRACACDSPGTCRSVCSTTYCVEQAATGPTCYDCVFPLLVPGGACYGAARAACGTGSACLAYVECRGRCITDAPTN